MKKSMIITMTVALFILTLFAAPTGCAKSDIGNSNNETKQTSSTSPLNAVDDVSDEESHDDEYLYGRNIDWNDNVIDEFFEYYLYEETDQFGYDFREVKHLRAQAWLAEVEHAYDLLRKGLNPHMPQEKKDYFLDMINKEHDAFIAYAEPAAELGVAVEQNFFSLHKDDSLDDPWTSGVGTAYGYARMNYLGDLYRDEAIRLYNDMSFLYNFEQQRDCLVFDENYWKSELDKVCSKPNEG